jgi:hypothetical protein
VTTIQFKVADLYEFEGALLASPQNPSGIIDLVKKQFSFLPQPIDIQADAEYVTISFHEEASEAKTEARRLAGKASKRAARGISVRQSASSDVCWNFNPPCTQHGETSPWPMLRLAISTMH